MSEEAEGIGDPRYSGVDEVMRYGAGRLPNEAYARHERIAEDAARIIEGAQRRKRIAAGVDEY
jgi:hypothetical protein